MSQPIEFYFDFSSPYGYIASEKIDAIAARYGREVRWHPFLLGVAHKVTGGRAPIGVALKDAYYKNDFERSARFHGVPYRLPSKFPIASLAPTRAFFWLEAKDAARAKALAKALYRAFFVEDVDISAAENVAGVCAKLGLRADEVLAALNDPVLKERTKAGVDGAVARGVFGSPHFIVDGEHFWGADRLDQLERWLATGGF
ncbi:MAG: 2-hydroxychromene-2-carboxylate isomerase [Betaproteobacteria bacterium]|nr:2-hydroxychromene-2-carboxylate isomerase [Betaproteobacteria bacterium]